jgi:hypothetical protein
MKRLCCMIHWDGVPSFLGLRRVRTVVGCGGV